MGSDFIIFSPRVFIQVASNFVCSRPVGNAVSTALPSTHRHLLTSPGRTTRRTAVASLVHGSLDHFTARIAIAYCHCLSRLRARHNPLLRVDSRVHNHLPRSCPSRLNSLFFDLLPTNSVAKTPGPHAIRVVHRTRACSHNFCANIANCFSNHGLSDTILVHFLRRRPSNAGIFGDKKKVAFHDSTQGRCRRVGRGICIPLC